MCACRCCFSHANSHNQVHGHRTGSSHFCRGVEEYPTDKIYPLFTASSCFCHSLACHVLSSCSQFSIGAIYVVFYSKPHPTPHVLLLGSWRSLTWSSKCDALLEIIQIIRCKSFVRCVYFLNIRSIVGTSISSTQRVLKALLLSTPEEYCE